MDVLFAPVPPHVIASGEEGEHADDADCQERTQRGRRAVLAGTARLTGSHAIAQSLEVHRRRGAKHYDADDCIPEDPTQFSRHSEECQQEGQQSEPQCNEAQRAHQ